MCSESFANNVAPEYTKELIALCNSSDPAKSEKCSGYIWGVGDTLFTESAMNDGHTTFELNLPAYTKLSVTLVLIALKTLVHTYPNKLNQPCVTSVIEAFQLLGVWKYKNNKNDYFNPPYSANAQLPKISNLQSSGPFYLQGGVVLPNGGQLRVSLDTLPIEMTYTITCDIENPNWNKPYPLVVSIFNAGKKSQRLLNQKITQYSDKVFIGYDATGRRWPRDFSFINHDDTDPAYVKNCIAIYAT